MLQVTGQDPGNAVGQRTHAGRPKVDGVGAADHLQLADHFLDPCHPAHGRGEAQDKGDEPSERFGIGLQVRPRLPQAHKDLKGFLRALVRMIHGDKSRAEGRGLPKGQARQKQGTRRDRGTRCRRLRCVPLCRREEDALPGPFPIGGVAEERNIARLKLADICSRELATLSPQDSVEDVVRLMREKAIRRLPVVEDGNRLVSYHSGIYCHPGPPLSAGQH